MHGDMNEPAWQAKGKYWHEITNTWKKCEQEENC